jgi:DNA-binding transcriptional LysR family regulator
LRKRRELGWDELRLVLAIARAGTLAGGARKLGIDHSTAFRRLREFESRLGVRMFDRSREGYTPTPSGEAVIAEAAEVDDRIAQIEQRLAGQDHRLSGTVRVTTTDTLMPLVAPLFARFRDVNPDVTLELVVSNEFLTLTRRDADVAIRPVARAPEALVGRRVSVIATAVYGAPAYLRSRKDATLQQHRWLAPDDTLTHLASARWIRRKVPGEAIACRANSLLALLAAARAGLGIAALPCYMADRDTQLRRVFGPEEEMASALWVLMHRDLRRVARVRAFLSAIADGLAELRPLLEGREAAAGRLSRG